MSLFRFLKLSLCVVSLNLFSFASAQASVTGTQSNANSITVQWSSFSGGRWNWPANNPTKYRVCWEEKGTVAFVCNVNTTSSMTGTSYTIQNLNPGTEYHVRVKVRTKISWRENGSGPIDWKNHGTTNFSTTGSQLEMAMVAAQSDGFDLHFWHYNQDFTSIRVCYKKTAWITALPIATACESGALLIGYIPPTGFRGVRVFLADSSSETDFSLRGLAPNCSYKLVAKGYGGVFIPKHIGAMQVSTLPSGSPIYDWIRCIGFTTVPVGVVVGIFFKTSGDGDDPDFGGLDGIVSDIAAEIFYETNDPLALKPAVTLEDIGPNVKIAIAYRDSEDFQKYADQVNRKYGKDGILLGSALDLAARVDHSEIGAAIRKELVEQMRSLEFDEQLSFLMAADPKGYEAWQNDLKESGESLAQRIEEKHGQEYLSYMVAYAEGREVTVEPPQQWTHWLNRDRPGGKGDYETIAEHLKNGNGCEAPTEIQCRATDGTEWTKTGEEYHCDTETGGWCINAEQSDGKCHDYEVRLKCP